MSRRSKRVAWLCVAAGGALGVTLSTTAPLLARQPDGAARSEADRAVEHYVERLGLTALRVEQLARRLAGASGAEQAEIAERLASLYGELLQNAPTAQERAHWEQKIREMLEASPQSDSPDLRLDLLRASFSRAERLAERWRLRLGESSQREEAIGAFASLAAELTRIGEQSHQRVEMLQRQEETSDVDPELISSRLAAARRQRSLAMYLAGWSRACAAEITGDQALAAEAMRNFGWLLSAAPGRPPTPESAPANMFHFEHVARAAIGAAVCESIRGDAKAALLWLDRIAETEETHPAARSELPARRMTILARLGRWTELATLVDKRREGAPQNRPALTVGEARLLAVLTLEGKPGASDERAVQSLASIAIAELGAHGELAQVLDIASRYSTAPIGSEGFVAHHVRGLRFYEQARAAHRRAGADLEGPATTADALRLYRQAADSLQKAYESANTDIFGGARASTALMLGLALYYGAGTGQDALPRLIDAAQWLETASELLADESRAADAMSTAIRAMDTAVDGARSDGAAARRDELVQSFIERFPDHDRAGAMLLKHATEGSLPPAEAVELLRRVPEHTPAHEPALRHRERLLYEMRREAPAAERDWAALRYAEVAEALLVIDRRRATSNDAAGDRDSASSAALLARRLLEALLSVPRPDASRAERALDTLVSLASAGLIDGGELRQEIDYRRAQIALARGDAPEAERIADALGAGDGISPSGDEWAMAANRLLFRHAVLAWRDATRAGGAPEQVADAARAVVRRGLRVTLDVGADDAAFRDPAVATLHATVAEAAAALWTVAGDRDARSLAIRLHRKLLAADPNSRVLLRRMAELSEAAGDHETALECWRTLSAGLDSGESEWFEARYRLVALLAQTDPVRAREVIDQHKAMHPDFGPAPWGEQLRALDGAIPGAQGAAPP